MKPTTCSPLLLRDYQKEAAFLAANPDCDNIRIAHCRRHLSQCGMYYDRSGKICYIFNTVHHRWHRQKICLHQCPAMKKRYRPAYKLVEYTIYSDDLFHGKVKKTMHPCLHNEIADIFLPNTDFTKTQIDHINGDHLDNRAENLERVTPEENIRRRYYNYYLKRGLPIPQKYLPKQRSV